MLIFERSAEGRYGTQVVSGLRRKSGQPGAARIPANLAAIHELPLPMVDELTLTRHYVELSQKTFGIDNGFYPLGSCTMKYNPKSLERLARRTGSRRASRAAPDTVPGFLRVMFGCKPGSPRSAALTR
jgi:glycine dehydrogenase subunit 2